MYNIRTASRVERYLQIVTSEEFRSDLSYLGVMFRAIGELNYRGKMIPTFDYYSQTINYKVEKFINLQEIMDLMK